MSAYQCDRLVAQSTEDREARLQRLSSNQHEILAAESAEEREAKLQRLSSNQRERLAAESAENREARLQYDRERESRSRTQFEPFKRRSVQLKMRRFHESLASLSSHIE